MRPLSATLLSLGAVAALLPLHAKADAAVEARLRDALRAATAQVRALEDERAAGQAREASLKKELETLRMQPKTAAACRPADRSDRELADLRRRLAEQSESAEKLSQGLDQCQAAEREGAEAARRKEDERGRLAGETAALHERLVVVEAKNERLYQLGKEIIEWLADMGVGAALAAREPFLGLRRVELENVAQNFEDMLLEQKVKPGRSTLELPSDGSSVRASGARQ